MASGIRTLLDAQGRFIDDVFRAEERAKIPYNVTVKERYSVVRDGIVVTSFTLEDTGSGEIYRAFIEGDDQLPNIGDDVSLFMDETWRVARLLKRDYVELASKLPGERPPYHIYHFGK